jgi:hypothetical protein
LDTLQSPTSTPSTLLFFCRGTPKILRVSPLLLWLSVQGLRGTTTDFSPTRAGRLKRSGPPTTLPIPTIPVAHGPLPAGLTKQKKLNHLGKGLTAPGRAGAVAFWSLKAVEESKFTKKGHITVLSISAIVRFYGVCDCSDGHKTRARRDQSRREWTF